MSNLLQPRIERKPADHLFKNTYVCLFNDAFGSLDYTIRSNNTMKSNAVLEIANDSYCKYAKATMIETCRTEISKKNVRLYLNCLYNSTYLE
jgi:hypothetical protein